MRRAPLTLLAAAAALALVSTAPRFAFAGDAAAAEALFREGVDKLKKGDAAGACDALKGSNELDPSPGTQINLAVCSEKLGKLASAWAWYRSAAGLADQRGQKERSENARKEADRLEPQLHKLVIKVTTQPEGLTITRDGTALPPATYGREVPVDPGPHVIEVSAKAKKPIKVTVNTDAAPGAQTWEVPALEDAPEDKTGTVPGGDARPPEGGGGGGNTQRNIGFVVGGAGIVALLTGAVLEIVAIGVNSDANTIDRQRHGGSGQPDCTDPATSPDAVVNGSKCSSLNSSYQAKKDAAKSDQLAAIITGAGGAVLIAVGATLILTSKSSSSSARSTQIVPMIGAGQAGLGVLGSF